MGPFAASSRPWATSSKRERTTRTVTPKTTPRIRWADRWLRSALILALAGLAVGSRADGEGPRSRWIEREPTATLDLAPVTEARDVGRRDFGADVWTVVRGEGSPDGRPGAPGLWLRAPEGRIEVETRYPFGAEAVDRFELRLEAPSPGGVELWWAAPGQDFDTRRRIRSRTEGGHRVVHFEVGRHPEWQGAIEGLRLVIHRHAGESVRLETFAAQRIVFAGLPTHPETGSPGAGARSREPLTWRVELDHTWRNALVTAAEEPPLRWRLPPAAAREGASLELALGTAAYPRRPLVFRVVAEGPGPGPAEVVLVEQGLTRLDGGRWHRVRAELPRLAGGPPETLRFELSGAKGEDPGVSPVFWAHPQVVVGPGSGHHRPPNLVLISIDTLRADRLSILGSPHPTTPHIDRWAEERAVIFEQAVAAAPWTLPSHISMLSGLGPLAHGIQHDAMTGAMPRLLAERLRRAGYHGEAITGGAYLHPAFGFGRGFEGFRVWPADQPGAAELADGIDRALAFLADRVGTSAGRGGPFFLFFHTYSVHDPYLPRPPFFERFAPAGSEAPPPGTTLALIDRPRRRDDGFREDHDLSLRRAGGLRNLDPVTERPLIDAFYDSGVAFMDRQLGRLLTALDALPPGQETVVVLTSDHGEALGDHGGEIGHVGLHDPTLHVPLLIAAAGGLPGLRVREPVASIDLVPTLLELLDLEDCSECEGQSLRPLMVAAPASPRKDRLLAWARRPILSYGAASNHGLAFRDPEGWTLHFDNNAWRLGEPGGRARLYHRGADDPEALKDRGGDSPERLGQLERQLRQIWRDSAQGLLLRLQNPGEGMLRGELRGAMILPIATKSIDLDCPCLEWVEEGKARFLLGPGEAFELLFEDVPDDAEGIRLEVRLEARDGQGRRRRHHGTLVPIPAPGQTAALAWRDGRFEPTVPPRLGRDPGLALFWQGPPRPRGESPTRLDPELRRRLEALGYW